MIENYQEYIEKRKIDLKNLSYLYSLNPNKNFDRLISKGVLLQSHVDFIEELKTNLEEVYPQQYDIQFELNPLFKITENSYGSNHVRELEVFDKLIITHINIVLHFPEFTIKNSKKESLVLKDLYARIPVRIANSDGEFVDGNRMVFESIEGTRLTVSIPEFQTKYAHSHLQSRDYSKTNFSCIKYQDFCTGSGDINAMQSLLNAGYDRETFQLLLHHIKGFIEWESLEGRPYRRLNEVISRSSDYPNTTFNDLTNYFTNLKQLVRDKRHKVTIDIDWKYINGQYVVIDNEKFESFLSSIRGRSPNNESNYWLYKDELNNYFVEKDINESEIGVGQIWLPFRGQKVYFNIEGQITRAINRNYYLHPKIKNYVKSRLEFYANNSKIRESGLTKLNTINNS